MEPKYTQYLDEVREMVEAGESIAAAARKIIAKYAIQADEETARRRYSHLLSRKDNFRLTHKPVATYRASNFKESYEESGDSASSTIMVPSTCQVKSVEDALKYCNVDLTKWEVVSWRFNVSESERSGGTNQIRILFKRKNPNRIDLYDNIDDLVKMISSRSPVYQQPKFHTRQNDSEPVLIEFCAYDLHYGKLCWAPETGEMFDSKIAEERLMKAVVDSINEVSNKNIDRILFAVGNDFFNSDNARNTTHAGTPQSEDSRWQKTFLGGCNLLIKAIDYMREFAPVDVVVVQGNHDWERVFYAGVVLEARYANCENVTIDNSPTPRKYYRYYRNLIGMTHGSEEKHVDLPMIMAQERPVDWAETKYREFHIGHLHHNKTRSFISEQDRIGVKVRILRSLTGNDSWHTLKGYIGQTQSAETYIWTRNAGLCGIKYHNI